LQPDRAGLAHAEARLGALRRARKSRGSEMASLRAAKGNTNQPGALLKADSSGLVLPPAECNETTMASSIHGGLACRVVENRLQPAGAAQARIDDRLVSSWRRLLPNRVAFISALDALCQWYNDVRRLDFPSSPALRQAGVWGCSRAVMLHLLHVRFSTDSPGLGA